MERLWTDVGIAVGSMLGLVLTLYIAIKIGGDIPNQPPIVAAVVAPVAPIVPGIVLQNNPMLLNGAA